MILYACARSILSTEVAGELEFVSTAVTWDEAKAHCSGLGARLASVYSESQNKAIGQLVGDAEVWLSGSWLGSAWSWNANDSFWLCVDSISCACTVPGKYANWRTKALGKSTEDHPVSNSKQCLQLNGWHRQGRCRNGEEAAKCGDWMWESRRCSDRKAFVCQYTKSTTGAPSPSAPTPPVSTDVLSPLTGIQIIQAALLSEWIYTAGEGDSPPTGDRVPLVAKDDSTKQESKLAAVYSMETKSFFLTWEGTNDPLDVLTDASFDLTPLDGTDISAHMGVYARWKWALKGHFGEDGVLSRHFKEIATGSMDVERIILTGHSLGGGIAQLALAYTYEHLHKMVPPGYVDVLRQKIAAITFAAPMVVATDAAEFVRFMASRYLNVVYINDVVPRLPGCPEYLLKNLDSFDVDVLDLLKRKLGDTPGAVASWFAWLSGTGKSSKDYIRQGADKFSPTAKRYRQFGKYIYVSSQQFLSLTEGPQNICGFPFDAKAQKDGEPSTLGTHHSIDNYSRFLLMHRRGLDDLMNSRSYMPHPLMDDARTDL